MGMGKEEDAGASVGHSELGGLEEAPRILTGPGYLPCALGLRVGLARAVNLSEESETRGSVW